jgi:hypothetical protein
VPLPSRRFAEGDIPVSDEELSQTDELISFKYSFWQKFCILEPNTVESLSNTKNWQTSFE